MNKDKRKRMNKRELLETDGYTRHNKARPYVRDNRVPDKELDQEAKVQQLSTLLGDWDANGE